MLPSSSTPPPGPVCRRSLPCSCCTAAAQIRSLPRAGVTRPSCACGPWPGPLPGNCRTRPETHLRFSIRGWNGRGDAALRDARWALGRIRDFDPGLPIVVVGHSLGGRVAFRVGGDPDVAGVVGLTPWTPSNAPAAQLAGVPVVVIQAGRDRVIPERTTRPWLARAEHAGAQLTRTVLPWACDTMVRRFWVWHRLAAQAVRTVLAESAAVGGPAAISGPAAFPHRRHCRPDAIHVRHVPGAIVETADPDHIRCRVRGNTSRGEMNFASAGRKGNRGSIFRGDPAARNDRQVVTTASHEFRDEVDSLNAVGLLLEVSNRSIPSSISSSSAANGSAPSRTPGGR